ncbi:MAG: HD domain-containing protein [Planctomycetota bacterium]
MKKLLKAANFSAVKHESQRRKNASASPYINHPIEVAEYLSHVGGVSDEDILVAALLHDTIEDTNTAPSEIAAHFGERVLELVLECTDDKSLEKAERKRLQIVTASKKSDGAKQIKLADKACNLKSILDEPPVGWSLERQLEYFNWANEVCQGLYGTNPELDSDCKQIIAAGIQQLNENC